MVCKYSEFFTDSRLIDTVYDVRRLEVVVGKQFVFNIMTTICLSVGPANQNVHLRVTKQSKWPAV